MVMDREIERYDYPKLLHIHGGLVADAVWLLDLVTFLFYHVTNMV